MYSMHSLTGVAQAEHPWPWPRNPTIQNRYRYGVKVFGPVKLLSSSLHNLFVHKEKRNQLVQDKLAFRRTQNFGARLGCQATFLSCAFLSNWAFCILSEGVFLKKSWTLFCLGWHVLTSESF